MELNTFLENGALITMSGGKTHFYQDLSASVNEKANYLLAPEFSLHELHKSYAFGHSSQNPDFLRFNQTVEKSNLDWTPDSEAYKVSYQKVQAYIQSGQLRKAVPFMNFKTLKPKDFNQKVLPQILNRLLEIKHDKEYIYGLWNKDQGFIGSTPEILIQKKPQQNEFNSMALAGTLPAKDNTDMLKDIKLSDEHQIVMDDIAKKLFDHKIKWSERSEKVYGILKHLYAEAKFESDLQVTELITRLSPTSALGVFPSDHWRDYSDILHFETRGSYGAPFGFVGQEETMILVCLRGLFWDKDHLYIRVGGGVTAQSVYETEVKELELKFLSTKTKLGL